MKRMRQGVALENQRVSEGASPSRRNFLKISAIGLGGVATIVLAPHVVRYFTSLRSQYPQELPEKKIRALMVRREFYLRQNGEVLTHAPSTTYYEIGGSVFGVQLVKAELDENGIIPTPLSLIYKADAKYNPRTSINANIADRALELFSILNRYELSGNLEENKILNFNLKLPPTPIVHSGVTYQLPVLTPYKSLEEAVASARR